MVSRRRIPIWGKMCTSLTSSLCIYTGHRTSLTLSSPCGWVSTDRGFRYADEGSGTRHPTLKGHSCPSIHCRGSRASPFPGLGLNVARGAVGTSRGPPVGKGTEGPRCLTSTRVVEPPPRPPAGVGDPEVHTPGCSPCPVRNVRVDETGVSTPPLFCLDLFTE